MSSLEPCGVVTITTDFGLKDGNVAAMKGVIWTVNPDARIADVSHLVPPQDVALGARLVAKRLTYFPAGSVHIVVVDPGVGTARRPLAARVGRYFVVGPDNGVFTPLFRDAPGDWEAVHLTERRFWLPKVSNVFHGRDIFAPVGAILSAGLALAELGEPLRDPLLLDEPQVERLPDGSLRGMVVELDHFGNLSLNITADDIAPFGPRLEVVIGGTVIPGLYRTFGELPIGELLAFIDSSDSLALAEVNGNLAARIGARRGQTVLVRPA
jgi:hypothetical protein